jgi:hypothetical protein
MSGGPIFGFKKTEEGLKYWIVAIQSWWDKKRRITFGCRVPTFARLLANEFEKAIKAK